MKKTLVAALAVAATLLTPLPAEAKQAPVLAVASVTDPLDPQVVPASGTDAEGIGFTVSSTEAASVTATASGTGLTISDANQVLAVTSSRAELLRGPRHRQHARVPRADGHRVGDRRHARSR